MVILFAGSSFMTNNFVCRLAVRFQTECLAIEKWKLGALGRLNRSAPRFETIPVVHHHGPHFWGLIPKVYLYSTSQVRIICEIPQ